MDKVEQLILDYIEGNLSAPDAAQSLKTAVDGALASSRFSQNEMVWLLYNFDLIPKIVENRICSAIFAHLHIARFGYLRQMMRLLQMKGLSKVSPDNTRPALYWLRKLEMAHLLSSHASQMQNRKYYALNRKLLPEVCRLIYDLIAKKAIESRGMNHS